MNGQIPLLGHQSGQIPQDQAVKMAIAQQVGQLTMQIYVRAASRILDSKPSHADLAELAAAAHQAAKAYFEGLGIEFE